MLQIDEAEIVAHEADDPNSVVNLLDAKSLTGKDGRDIDLLSMHADAAAGVRRVVPRLRRQGQRIREFKAPTSTRTRGKQKGN